MDNFIRGWLSVLPEEYRLQESQSCSSGTYLLPLSGWDTKVLLEHFHSVLKGKMLVRFGRGQQSRLDLVPTFKGGTGGCPVDYGWVTDGPWSGNSLWLLNPESSVVSLRRSEGVDERGRDTKLEILTRERLGGVVVGVGVSCESKMWSPTQMGQMSIK